MLLISIGFLAIVWLLYLLGFSEYYFILPITLLVGIGLLHRPRLWLSFYVLATGLYLTTGGEGISAIEIVLGASLNGGLLLWLIGYKFIGNSRYIRGISEYMFVVFHILSLLNISVALFNGVEILNWLRVYLVISLVFYYIPLRVYFGTDEGTKKILKLLGIVVLIIVAKHFYTYYTYVTNIEMAYQIGKGVRENLGFLSTITVIVAGFVYSIQRPRHKLIVLSLMILVTIALVTTFARTYWGTSIVGLILLLYYLRPAEKILTVSFIIGLAILVVIILQLILGDIYVIVIEALSERASSAGKGTADVSIMMRLVEYQEAFKQISFYPLGGLGLAAQIDFYIPQVMDYWKTHNIHNSYIYAMYKLGIPLAILYTSSFVLLTIRSFLSIRRQNDKFHRYLAVGIFSGFIMTLFAGFFANNFFARDSVILISYLIFFSSNLYHREKNSKIV